MVKIGFLGPQGTFSQEAAQEYIKDGLNYTLEVFNSIQELVNAVDEGQIDEAIAPMENSLEGAVNSTLDMLSGDCELFIKDELVLPIKQNLLSKGIKNFGEVKYILSHPQAIGQCRKFISSNMPHAQIINTHSTSAAAEEVANGKEEAVAIGSAAASKVYDLEVLASNIQDLQNNLTRFVVLSKKDNIRTGKDKSSIVFSTEDKPGSLYSVLDIFNLWDINMTRIESRPSKDMLGKYIFFLDIEGHKEDQDLKDALTMVKRKSSFYKFLGSYPQKS